MRFVVRFARGRDVSFDYIVCLIAHVAVARVDDNKNSKSNDSGDHCGEKTKLQGKSSNTSVWLSILE
jgi:hypothetical protein